MIPEPMERTLELSFVARRKSHEEEVVYEIGPRSTST